MVYVKHWENCSRQKPLKISCKLEKKVKRRNTVNIWDWFSATYYEIYSPEPWKKEGTECCTSKIDQGVILFFRKAISGLCNRLLVGSSHGLWEVKIQVPSPLVKT